MEGGGSGLRAGPVPLALALKSPIQRPSGCKVCVIGGGGTGAACAYDLSLRGFSVVLLERGELTSGTTGRHHGQLHCGARYAWADKSIARECHEESVTLSRIAGECIEYNGGLFVATSDDEADRAGEFLEALAESGIPARLLSAAEALAMEPSLAERTRRAVMVPDGSFDAYRLPLMFFTAARALGATILPWHEVVGIESQGGRTAAVIVADRSKPEAREIRIESEFIVNAAGAWAGKVGALAGTGIPVTPAPGTMVAVRGRIVDRVVSRLRPPGDGDILVPQRGLSIIGTTQRSSCDPDALLPLADEVAFLNAAAALMVPAFSGLAPHAAWAAARPLFGSATGEAAARSLSRDFGIIDHELSGGPAGFATVIGGKATVLRAMAEKIADLVCAKLGIVAPCRTTEYLLPSWRKFYRSAGS
jgi:glycerol-3-phosphate dehydrogenase